MTRGSRSREEEEGEHPRLRRDADGLRDGGRLARPDGLHLFSTSPPTPSASSSPTVAAASAAKSLLLPSPLVAVSPAGPPLADDAPPLPFVIGVPGGTASGKTTVCDMVIQQLHDHRVVLVNQVKLAGRKGNNFEIRCSEDYSGKCRLLLLSHSILMSYGFRNYHTYFQVRGIQ